MPQRAGQHRPGRSKRLMPYKNKVDKAKIDKARTASRRDEWFKANGPCRKCGSWERLELDHVQRNLKLGHRIWSWSADKTVAELVKCQVLCHRCHRKKTNGEIRHIAKFPMAERMRLVDGGA